MVYRKKWKDWYVGDKVTVDLRKWEYFREVKKETGKIPKGKITNVEFFEGDFYALHVLFTWADKNGKRKQSEWTVYHPEHLIKLN